MISVFKFIKNLDHKRRNQVLVLIFLMLISNFAEVLSIALIPPYLALIADKTIIDTNEYLIFYKSLLGVNEKNFLIIIGISIFILILFSNIFLAIITFLTKRIINNLNNSILSELFNYYINIRFEESFLNKNSLTKITTKINNEVLRFTNQTLLPFFEIIKRCFAILIMTLVLFYIEPVFTIYIVFFFTVVLIIFYFGLHKKLVFFGKKFTDHTKQKLSLVIETFSALKEVKFLGIQKILMREFFKNNIKLSNVDVIVYLYANLPRYILEILASLLFISLLIIFIWNDQDFSSMIYTLSFIVVGAYKILPSLNTIMFNFSIFKSALPAYDFIKDDLDQIKKINNNIDLKENNIHNINEIEIVNLNYSYPNTNVKILKNINLKFKIDNNYFILGASGSGKSTLIDIICGIIQPKDFIYKINSKNYTIDKLNTLNDHISYVPQQINFFDRSLIENITLKFNDNLQEDYNFVLKIISILDLNEFINSLPDGLDSYLGEKSQNMSGGQRQRLSIARALFRRKPILVFDEATSSIDFKTEKKIFENIKKLNFIKSIIAVTHRETILQENDNCIFINNGEIIFNDKYIKYNYKK